MSLRRRAQALELLRAKLLQYEDTMQKLKQQSEELEEIVLESRLKDLTPKQKLAIMQCFQGARPGYVARKTVLKGDCRDCFDELLVAPQDTSKDLATLTHFCDNGGLLYPSEQLFTFVEALEMIFTTWFSYNELHHDSFAELTSCLQRNSVVLGCAQQGESLTN
ncbi:hypothetical protein HPB50_008850 [Hyalomma asiaticum]|uniref:Uncharacterized protein n=1 Tax=Hyalomma asiaticum TaxID=266040 RepID=A0ACB7SX64_HYAAI|nr:hypothetical protein HPB50_008850 [Hyalomma asiaticum]